MLTAVKPSKIVIFVQLVMTIILSVVGANRDTTFSQVNAKKEYKIVCIYISKLMIVCLAILVMHLSVPKSAKFVNKPSKDAHHAAIGEIIAIIVGSGILRILSPVNAPSLSLHLLFLFSLELLSSLL